MGSRLPLRCLAVGLFLTWLPSARAAGPWLQGIGVASQDARSVANGVSDDGAVVVGDELDAGHGNGTPLRWDALAGIALLPKPPGTWASARAVSGDGAVVVGTVAEIDLGADPPVVSAQAGFRWDEATGSVLLGALDEPNVRSSAHAASFDGSVIVGSLGDAEASHAVYWAGGSAHPIPGLPEDALGSVAWGVTRDGAVIVGSVHTAEGTHAFRWSEEDGALLLADLPGGALQAEAIAASDDGTVIVGVASDERGRRAVRWIAGGPPQDLGELPGGSSDAVAVDVSADGATVVGHASLDGSGAARRAFVWTEAGGMRDLHALLADELGLDLGGWELAAAQGITSDGRTVVGSGWNPDGVLEGWIAYLPEPHGGALAAAALAGLGALARARRPAARRMR